MIALVALSLAAIAQEPGAFVPSPAPSDSTSLPELQPRGESAKVDEARARQLGQQFAACVTRGSRGAVRDYLAAFPSSTLAAKRVQAVLNEKADSCARVSEMTFSGNSLRGALYEAMYRRDFSTGGPMDFSAISPIDYATGEGADTAPTPLPEIALRLFADCAVRADVAGARALVLSPISEPGEQSALRAFLPAMKGCLPKDRQLSFSPSMARALVAETLYRLSEKAKEASL